MAHQQQRYKVIEKLASGGMAEVFRAESAGLEGFKKTVAIKRVLPHLSQKKQFMGMFIDEARLSAHLSHSNCVQVFDIGIGDDTYFIVMEYIDGADLKAVIEHQRKMGGSVPIEEACLICVRICEGLSYAHELRDGKGHHLGIVHRDMSPPNVLITRHGEVKIVDFGLAKANSQLEQSEPGIIKGKFSYLSPEAARGEPVDARTDIFAVGIILWEMLANRRLFLGDTDLETVRQVQSAAVPPIRQFNRRVTPEIERILAKALTQHSRDRYQTARELGQDLNNVLFHLDRAVSSFDIANLVESASTERVEKKKKKNKQSIISSLIEEELFEFRSIEAQDDEKSQAGSLPLEIGGFASDEWGDKLGGLGYSDDGGGVETSLPDDVEPFNLAALEEDTMGGLRRDDDEDDDDADQLAMPKPPSSRGRAPGGGMNTSLIIVLVVLVLLGGVAGAYFAGAIQF